MNKTRSGLKLKTWGFVGCGNLAQAIISGLIRSRFVVASQITASNRSEKKLNAFARKVKIKKAKTNLALASASDILVLGTKPQDLSAAVQSFSNSDHFSIVISLAAGVSVGSLKKLFPNCPCIVRVMGNTPAKFGNGVFGIYFNFQRGVQNKKSIQNYICKAFESLGHVEVVNGEAKIDAITAACASGVGFAFEMIHRFETWLVDRGFDKKTARLLAQKTFLGASQMLKSLPESSTEELRDAVTSKKGTTLAGLKMMHKLKVQLAIEKSLDAAASRARELSKEFDDSITKK